MAPATAAGDPPAARASGAAGAPPLAVIDTNVWLDLYVFGDARAAHLAQALADGRLGAVRSASTDDELVRVLARPAFAQRSDAAGHARHLSAWMALAAAVEGEAGRAPWTCRDAQDQKFLDLACAAGARWLLTKDRALLDLARAARRTGLAIATPEDFALP